MNHKIKFRSVADPVSAAATGKYDEGFGTHSQLPVHDIAIGALDRFTEDFKNYVAHEFPDMVAGDDLTVYHQYMPNQELSPRVRNISDWCRDWASKYEHSKSP